MKVDIKFSLYGRGDPLPADHAYPLFSAISRIVPAVHNERGFGIHPIIGAQTGDRRMVLTRDSSLKIRLDTERIAEILPLAGKTLGFGASFLQIGVPSIFPLNPAPSLRSRLVNIKGFMESEPFADAVRRQLDALEVSPDVEIVVGKRRTLKIRSANVVGFEVVLNGLTFEESTRVQEAGIGGRRKLGCGIFVPRRVVETRFKERSRDNAENVD